MKQHRRLVRQVIVIGFLTLVTVAARTSAAELVPESDDGQYDAPKKEPPALPKEFAFVFSLPYGLADEFPREPEEFERMLVLLKGAGYNTVHCTYLDWRHELFKKHKMRMMIDVLAWKPPVEADIRRNDVQRGRVKEICEKCRGSDAIWGYNLWNERLDWCGNFEKLDLHLRMLRTWDPTHPVWVGTYRYLYSEHYPTHPGVVAWYDYHWKRGMPWHFAMLKFYKDLAPKRRSVMGRWLLIGNVNENMYTLNTSIPFGLKTCIWFIGGPYASREPDTSKRWQEDMHLIRIGRHMQPLYQLIGQMGRPTAVYSTPTLRTAANQDKPKNIPGKISPFPDDHWLQVKQGEVLCGFFKMPDKSDIVWVANHNAYAWQGVVLKVQQSKEAPLIVSKFNRETAEWEALGARDRVNFAIPPADAHVLRFERAKPTSTPLGDDGRDAAVDYDPHDHFQRIGKLLREKELLAEGKQPVVVYSTSTSRTKDNRDKEAGLPMGTVALPDDYLLQVKQGELLAGVFKLKGGADVVCFANHNALTWQGGLIVPRQDTDKPTVIWELDQKSNGWAELGTWKDINFPIPPAGSAVFKFATATKTNTENSGAKDKE